ncbi:hypothetical protein IQ273_14710 [Nodosilinea sp. LEGE 07298]|uniref:hypothetical protein n=1 Tax=Nodosilinea sp. LEGE 07298 TaxID=2777970 RepID=UPI00187E4BD4|nr:hypothetical protein [Nodosilinea sp. LEGE 07298]MBE9110670.1 hypothetical protein [Nodosilinea sp. LEGE 07298]
MTLQPNHSLHRDRHKSRSRRKRGKAFGKISALGAVFALIALALIALKVLLDKGDYSFPEKLLLYSNDVPWLLIGILVTVIGYVIFFGFYVTRPVPSPRTSSFSRQVSEPRIPTYWSSSANPPSQRTTAKTTPSSRAAPPPSPPNPRVQRSQPTESAQPSADRSIPPNTSTTRRSHQGRTYDELREILNDSHTPLTVLASLNDNENSRPMADMWVLHMVLYVDFVVSTILLVPYHIYMWLMTGSEYREWSNARRTTADTPSDIGMFIVDFVVLLFKGTIANWGRSIGKVISKNSNVGRFDPTVGMEKILYGSLLLIVKVGITFWLIKYFFIAVLPINIAQAFLRGFIKWFVGFPGKLILHIIDSFIL